MDLRIPYDRSYLTVLLPDDRIKGILTPKGESKSGDGASIVRQAMQNPIGSPTLQSLAEGKDRILIITSDHTRPVPSRVILPLMLEEIKRGNPNAHVKVMIASGLHRETTREELEQKFGGILNELDIEMHDGRDLSSMVYKGILPSGGELWLNNLVDWAQLIVSEGFIEPHFFAGFSGGRKCILPGVASCETVFANHCSKFIADKNARTGILEGNPIHEDMVFAAKSVGLAYIVNVSLDSGKNIIAAFAGDPFLAHEAGCRFVDAECSVERVEADIVITSNGGYPLDQNVYQAVKGMSAAEVCVRKGGVIIICSACTDGHGGEDFYRYFADGGDAAEIYSHILKVPQAETQFDQWQAQILARILIHASVIMVCGENVKELVCQMGMKYAPTLEEAVSMAEQLTSGREIVVIPDGTGIIVRDPQ